MLFQKKNPNKDYFMDFVSRIALPSFCEGKLSYARILQGVFIYDDALHYHIEAANAYTKLLAHCTAKQLISIEENCRHYLEYYDWDTSCLRTPVWTNINMSRQRFRHLSDTQYLSVLKLGTFHADGYCRQKCMRELSAYADTLPFFILRMNDWVEEIREEAFIFAYKRLEVCDIHELASALPMLDKLKGSRRRKNEYLDKIERFFAENIASKTQAMELDKIHTYEVTIKNSIYRFVNRTPVLSLEAMDTLLQYERESYGKRMLILGIFRHYDISVKKMDNYLTDKSPVVRYETLVYRYYTKTKEPWENLPELLMDRCKKIRLEASYILEKHKIVKALDYYKARLSENVSAIAISGIGEQGSISDIGVIIPYLEDEDERLVKVALTAYISLMAQRGEEIYWKYLIDDRASVCKQAYLSIKKFQIHYGAERLYNEYLAQDNELIRKFLLELLCTDPSTWGRLPWLLRLWGSDAVPEEQEYKLRIAIGSRSMYGRVSQREAQIIRDLLDELSENRPLLPIDRLRKSIEFDLKFVTQS